MSNEYKINTLIDILELEDDQIDRLCAELPRVLKYAKAMKNLIQVSSGIDVGIAEVCKIVSPLTWIDDGKQEITCTARFSEDDNISMVINQPIQG